MHRIFGNKLDIEYYTRPGAYIIPEENGKIAVVNTPKGYFLLGGGYENKETDEECIKRECFEEIGYSVLVGEKMCSAEAYVFHPKVKYFHPVQTYYTGRLISKDMQPIEKDHILTWVTYGEIKGKMFSEMQNWAIDIYFEKYNNILNK